MSKKLQVLNLILAGRSLRAVKMIAGVDESDIVELFADEPKHALRQQLKDADVHLNTINLVLNESNIYKRPAQAA